MKKNAYYIGLLVVIIVVGVFAAVEISRRIANDTVTDQNRHEVGKKPAELVTIGKAPAFAFTDQNNNPISNKDYEGKVYIVDFFFVNCPTICPVMSQNLVKIQNAFEGENIGFASFTINPEVDTPEVLKAYADKYGVTNPSWHFLTGDVDDIYELANKSFNLYAGKGSEEAGGFEHSGMFALIDQNGNIISRKDAYGNPIVYYDGLNDDGIKMLSEDVRQLLGKKK
ncbi:MAG: SCO family protein [Capnocytophaga sp.]|nr:SCO family protein [Capnocytophaga sp.]